MRALFLGRKGPPSRETATHYRKKRRLPPVGDGRSPFGHLKKGGHSLRGALPLKQEEPWALIGEARPIPPDTFMIAYPRENVKGDGEKRSGARRIPTALPCILLFLYRFLYKRWDISERTGPVVTAGPVVFSGRPPSSRISRTICQMIAIYTVETIDIMTPTIAKTRVVTVSPS